MGRVERLPCPSSHLRPGVNPGPSYIVTPVGPETRQPRDKMVARELIMRQTQACAAQCARAHRRPGDRSRPATRSAASRTFPP